MVGVLGAAGVMPGTRVVLADSLPLRMCSDSPSAPACAAVRGDRSEGWAPQSRSEAMVQHGVVSTVQPLAAMAGAPHRLPGGGDGVRAGAAPTAGNVTHPRHVPHTCDPVV